MFALNRRAVRLWSFFASADGQVTHLGLWDVCVNFKCLALCRCASRWASPRLKSFHTYCCMKWKTLGGAAARWSVLPSPPPAPLVFHCPGERFADNGILLSGGAFADNSFPFFMFRFPWPAESDARQCCWFFRT